MGAAPNPRTLTGRSGASSHVLRFPLRAFLRFPGCPPGSFPFVRLPLVSRRPAFSGSFPSAVARFRFPSVSLRVPFPLGNVHVSAAAGRFRRRRSRAAGTKVTSSAATTSPGPRDPPALQMGSSWARWDAATESPCYERPPSAGHRRALTGAALPGRAIRACTPTGPARCRPAATRSATRSGCWMISPPSTAPPGWCRARTDPVRRRAWRCRIRPSPTPMRCRSPAGPARWLSSTATCGTAAPRTAATPHRPILRYGADRHGDRRESRTYRRIPHVGDQHWRTRSVAATRPHGAATSSGRTPRRRARRRRAPRHGPKFSCR